MKVFKLKNPGTWLNILVKQGQLSQKAVQMIDYEAISNRYGWLPSQIRKENNVDMAYYMAILHGKELAQKKNKKPAETDPLLNPQQSRRMN